MKGTKKPALLVTILLLTLSMIACSSSKSYSYYEFYCEGDMTVSSGNDFSAVLSDEDTRTLLGLWGNPWTAEKVWLANFDHTFSWEETTIRYASGRGIFMLDGTKKIIRLSRDERKIVNDILDNYV